MSLLRNFSPGGSEPDDDEQSTTEAGADETSPPRDGQATGTPRYAFADPAAGTGASAAPAPGGVVPSEVVSEPDPSGPPEEIAPAPVAEAPVPEEDRMPSFTPAREADAPQKFAPEAPAPETVPVPPVQAAPMPVPPPRATDGPAAMPEPGFTAPLLGDTAELRTRWQRVQGDFVDDPQAAVSNAADLVGQTAEALVGALRQRQRQLRAAWERGTADGQPTGGMTPGAPDTEQLRLMMQRYRALFNELCRSS
jgi:hypothetical protein